MALTGKNAQQELETTYGRQKATLTDLIVDSSGLPDKDKWDGELTINGYTALKKIDFTKNLMDKLIIINCPNLEEIDINDNDFKKVDLSQIAPPNTNKLKSFFANQNKLEEINFKNCKQLEELHLNGCGEIKKIEGGSDIDEKLKVIEMEGTSGLSFAGTTELKELKDVKEASEAILGGSGKVPTKKDPITGKDVVDVDKLKDDLKKGAATDLKNEKDKAESELETIISELGLKKGATQQQIIDKIRELKGGPDYKSERDRLKTENENNKRRIEELEDKENKRPRAETEIIKELEVWGINPSEKQKESIKNAITVEKREQARNEIVKAELGRLKGENNSSFYLNLGLGVLTIASLGICTWILLRENEVEKLKPKKKEDKNSSK